MYEFIMVFIVLLMGSYFVNDIVQDYVPSTFHFYAGYLFGAFAAIIITFFKNMNKQFQRDADNEKQPHDS